MRVGWFLCYDRGADLVCCVVAGIYAQVYPDWICGVPTPQEEDVETIIEEMKEKMGVADIKEEEKETTKADKLQKAMEVVNEGLMQVHGSAPNSKQDGVF
jgi:hypothetical protein